MATRRPSSEVVVEAVEVVVEAVEVVSMSE